MNGVIEGGDGATDRVWAPALDVWETEGELVYAFDLPGIPEDKLSVEIENGVLTVTGERECAEEVKDERFYRYEQRFGAFQRAITLPQGVSEDSVKADSKNGVLEVHVRKPEQPKAKRIRVGSADRATIEG